MCRILSVRPGPRPTKRLRLLVWDDVIENTGHQPIVTPHRIVYTIQKVSESVGFWFRKAPRARMGVGAEYDHLRHDEVSQQEILRMIDSHRVDVTKTLWCWFPTRK
jgi:hypothetical protein